ncbi:twin-arginine translocation signal domain-containing protein [Haloarcula rubripromontorii]|uniref:Twin-arginine translocation signal domain-containing protein n=1 Tax=Haloarcula rubripromontorii TaxID=1705562 RepID=A0A847TFM2_9EURY|nr:twin-arginine translocation signal domain-containing protein [Haloarcula rubripromontorii]NLV04602.1 twin-arginine translocation signal domain-containing protein [Haloarcula rubripromontorii]
MNTESEQSNNSLTDEADGKNGRNKSLDGGRQGTINRRDYLKAGAVTVAALVGANSVTATASSQQTQYMTDFSEYAL